MRHTPPKETLSPFSRTFSRTFSLAFFFSAALMGCQNKSTPKPASAVSAPASTQDAPSLSKLSKEQTERLSTTLKAYEALRSALAQDKLSDVSDLAAQLERSLKEASEGATQNVSAQLSVMREAALKLKDKALSLKSDEQRRLFGEVSKGVVTLLSTHKSLAQGLHVFSCPMAQGYKKWVQPSSKLENPYMGGRMLRCGGRSDLSP